MIKVGMMIGDRYEIIEKIGTGGMSDVYKAKDHKLNRLVAVKVLKQEFSENANFVSKFRVEAQAAAGLMHPNIVNVYDVGEEAGINYIVMELVEGITLKKYIEKKARLSVREATSIAMQIALGIEAAHNKHIIHRDIKPQNVIISNDGKVKVTDFGIAKAATSNTITSNVMGSVHYTSPEQARGGYSDEKSDIYSLGITFFEMLTGRVPFNGDTTVAIAIKQIQEEMPSPKDFVAEIPVSVEQIVLKCTQKSPDRRYPNMAALIADLKQSFITPDENFVNITSSDDLGATRLRDDAEIDAIRKNVVNTGFTADLPRVSTDNSDNEYDPKMEKITTVLLIVVGILIAVLAIFLIGKAVGLFKAGKETPSSITVISESIEKIEQVVMPDVVDKDYAEAMNILETVNLKSKIEWNESEEIAQNKVISTSVKAGLKVDVGTEIVIYVSSGTKSTTVPDVVGMSLNTANKKIMDAKLTPNIQQANSDTVQEGFVIFQSPGPDEKAPIDSEVTIVISLGKAEELVEMIDVKGSPYEDAVIALTEKGFQIGLSTQVYSEVYAEGYVCYQSVSAGSDVPKGTVVDLEVSRGPEPVAPVTYSYQASINPPSTAEDPDFSSGTEVSIVISDDNGKEWYNSTTTVFPVNVNILHMASTENGHITLKYTVTIPTTDPETNETTTTKEERTIVRDISFVKDE